MNTSEHQKIFTGEPMPSLCKTIQLNRLLSHEQWEFIQSGLLQERWKARIEDGKIHLFRRGTEFCIFIVNWVQTDSGFEIVDMIVNRDPEQYSSTDDDEDISLVNVIIDSMLSGNYQYLMSMVQRTHFRS
jgi:hypothetical protein